MKVISFALAMVLVLLTVYSGSSYGGEFPYELKGCGTSERTIIDKADDVVIGQSFARGVTESVPQGGPFDKMIYECGGHWQLSKTGFEISQSCTFVDPDGDKTGCKYPNYLNGNSTIFSEVKYAFKLFEQLLSSPWSFIAIGIGLTLAQG